MLRAHRRKPPDREDFVLLLLRSASKNTGEQAFPHADKQAVGFCGKIEGPKSWIYGTPYNPGSRASYKNAEAHQKAGGGWRNQGTR
jgi:hypothetical protein